MTNQKETNTTLNTSMMEAVENIKLETIKDYVRPYQLDGGLMRKFTAKGVQHLALMLGVSITKSEYKETSDGRGLYFSATAETKTGQSYIAHVFQPYKKKNKQVNNPVETGSTRAARNAMLGLIPTDHLLRKIEAAIEAGTLERSVIEQAMNTARVKLREQKEWLASKNYSMEQAFQKIQEIIGDAEAWEEREWNLFTEILEQRTWLNPESYIIDKEMPF